MRKRIFSAMLLAAITTTGAIADETKLVDLKPNYKNTNEMLNDIKTKMPKVYDIVSDYFQAKTCKDNIAKEVSIKEIRQFLTTLQFGVLVAQKYQENESPIIKESYNALMNGYRAMNCGNEESIENYFGSLGTISSLQNNNNKQQAQEENQ